MLLVRSLVAWKVKMVQVLAYQSSRYCIMRLLVGICLRLDKVRAGGHVDEKHD